MDQHIEDCKVQAAACSALAMIALNSQESKARYQEAGVVKRIVAAMRKHLTDRQVQGMACYALMSSINADTSADFEAEDAIQSILAAAAAHQLDFFVQDGAWWALWTVLRGLPSEDRKKLLSGQARAKGVIMSAMADTRASDKTRECGKRLVEIFDGIELPCRPGAPSCRVIGCCCFATTRRWCSCCERAPAVRRF